MEANAMTPTSDRDLTPGTHSSAPVPNRRRLATQPLPWKFTGSQAH